MNKNRLLIALVVLAVLGALLVSSLRSRQSDTVVQKPKATLPKLKRDEISKVELDNPEKQLKLTLTRQDGKWAISAPFPAKADTAAVDGLLDKLSTLEVVRVAATHKENYELVGVDAAHGIHVKAYAADKLLLDAIIGKSSSYGTTLRKEGEEQVLAVRGSIRYAFDRDLKSFRDRTITDSDPATFTGLVLTSAKGHLRFEKPEAVWLQPKGEKPVIKDFASSKVESLVATFAKLRATDFAEPGATAESTGLATPQAKLVLTPKEGAPLTLELGSLADGNNDYFVRSSQSDVIYRVSKYTGDRLLTEPAAFSEPPKKPGEEPPPAPQGMPMGGGGELPPELLKQLQEQMGQRGPH